jgi:hypothetical protein
MTKRSLTKKILARAIETLAGVSLVFASSSLAQSSWQMKPDSMNLGILVLDYQTYAFEKGNFSAHQPCGNEDADSLPFFIHYDPPLDWGGISFLYSKNLDTLFNATIIWMGRGEIGFPRGFLPADSFKIQQTNVAAPISFQYYEFGTPVSLFQKKADSAWNAAKSLQVVKDFSQHPYRVGIYLYPPSVGAFDPSVAKWIVFLYQGKVNTSVSQPVKTASQHPLIKNFANAGGSKMAVTYQTATMTNATVAFYNAKGVKMAGLAAGVQEPALYTANFDIGKWANGMYFCRVSAGNVTDVKRIMISR